MNVGKLLPTGTQGDSTGLWR